MTTRAERKVAGLVDAFITGSFSGTRPDIKSFMADCPAGLEGELLEALEAIQCIMDYHYQPEVSEELVQEGIRRLVALQEKKQKLAQVDQGLIQILKENVSQPIDLIAGLFGWQGRFISGDYVQGRVPAGAGVMYRGKPSISRTNDRLVRDAQMMVSERALCEKAESLLQRTFATTVAPVDVDATAERLCLLVRDALLEDMDGCLVSDGNMGVILTNRALAYARRRRFTVAHEIGHFVLHKTSLKQRGHFSDGSSDLHDFNCSEGSEEAEANVFASCLLMPQILLPSSFGQNKPMFADVESISEEFDVSLAAAARRLVRASHWRCALVVSQHGQVMWHALSQQFEGWQSPWKSLQKGTVAQLLASGSETDRMSEQMPATYWLEGDVAEEGVEVLEDSKRLGDGYVYSLVTVLD